MKIENIYIQRHTIGLNISTCTSSLLQKFKAQNNFLMSSDLQKIKWSVQSLCLNVTNYCPSINNYYLVISIFKILFIDCTIPYLRLSSYKHGPLKAETPEACSANWVHKDAH